MSKIADLISTLSSYLDAQRRLAQCRARAIGEVDYYSYGYRLDMKRAEQALAEALNSYIDQRLLVRDEQQLPPRHLPASGGPVVPYPDSTAPPGR